MEGIVLVAIIAGLGFWLFKMTGGTRGRVEIRVEDGRTWVIRGRVPGRLLREIHSVCRESPRAKGTLRIDGTAREPQVEVEDLPRDLAQRLRNVICNSGR